MNPQAPRYFSLAELCTRWQVSDPTLRRWMRTGQLAVFRMGMKIRVTEEEVARVEAGWQQELQTNRQAWNQKIAERRQALEDQA